MCVKHVCGFYSQRHDTCDYLLKTGRRRGCPIETCERYKEYDKIRARKNEVLKRYAEVQSLYDQGLTDEEIAKKVGCSAATVSDWRYRWHIPKNEKETKADD